MHKYTKLKFDEAGVCYGKERDMEWAKLYSTGRNSTSGVLSFLVSGIGDGCN